MSNCPCGSDQPYENCCEPAHTGTTPSKTAEALMRSRYCAYVKKCIPYLGESLHPDHREDWSEENTKRWADNSEWLSLDIISTEAGLESDEQGVVEFSATFKEANQKNSHHEISNFQKIDNRWYYVDGETPKPETVRNESPKVGRNDPCPCGSGKKYKKCCK
jgi:SEC-C motif-containing protein